MKKRYLVILIIIVILAGAGYWAWNYFGLSEAWQIAKFNVESQRAIQALENYFKNDTAGGKTPQETYALYLEALKRGDLDAASLYFFWERQVEQKQKLEDLKTKRELEKYIAELPKWGDLKEEEYGDSSTKQYSYEIYEQEKTEKLPDGKGGYIEKKWPSGNYKYTITFWLNSSSNIWKFYSL